MPKIIISHRDPNKAGATEHVDAIIKAISKDSKDVVFAIVENKYELKEGKLLPVDLTSQLNEIKAKHGNAEYLVITGDYGADKALHDANVGDTFKRVLGNGAKVLMSSSVTDNANIARALEKGSIDFLATPEHAVKKEVLAATLSGDVIDKNRDKLTLMTSVPHLVTKEALVQKHSEWKKAVEDGKVKAIPYPDKAREMVAIVIPGDVEDANGKPKLFRKKDAIALADAIAKRMGKKTQPLIMVSNGPRTGKYNEALFKEKNYNPNHPAVQNAKRMDSIDNNPVTKAFIDRLKKRVGEKNIVLGCIEKGKTPPQGFLAFYDALNTQASIGGKATLYIDGISTSMLSQAANVMDSRVQIIACDTPAKNKTHEAGLDALFEAGHLDKLTLKKSGYVFEANSKSRADAKQFDDAAIVAGKVSQILGLNYSQALYQNEIAQLQKGNPAVEKIEDKDSSIVWMFSGRTSVLGNSDGEQEKRAEKTKSSGQLVDPTDDIGRLLLSIEVSKKRGGTKILFLGTDDENKDFKLFLDACRSSDSLASFKDNIPAKAKSYFEANYTDEKLFEVVSKFKEAVDLFIIDGKGIKNSIDQVKAFNKFLQNNEKIKFVDGVSSLYHLPRLARSISHYVEAGGEYERLAKIEKFELYGSDLACERPGTKQFDFISEPDAIGNYIYKGLISQNINSKVYLSSDPVKYRNICAGDNISPEVYTRILSSETLDKVGKELSTHPAIQEKLGRLITNMAALFAAESLGVRVEDLGGKNKPGTNEIISAYSTPTIKDVKKVMQEAYTSLPPNSPLKKELLDFSKTIGVTFSTKKPLIIALPKDGFIFSNMMDAVNYGWENSVKNVLRECFDGKHEDKFPGISGYGMAGIWLRQASHEEVETWLNDLTKKVLDKRQELMKSGRVLTPLQLLEESYGALGVDGKKEYDTKTFLPEVAKKIGATIGNQKYLEKYVEGFDKYFKEGTIKITSEADALFKKVSALQAQGEDVRLLRLEYKRQWVMDGTEAQIIASQYPSLQIENRGLDEQGGAYINTFPSKEEQSVQTIYISPHNLVETSFTKSMTLPNVREAVYESAAKGNLDVIAIDSSIKQPKASSVTLSLQGREDISIPYPVTTIDNALQKIDRALESYSLEVINQHTPNYLDKIDKPVLTMLVHMLEDLGYPKEKVDATKKAFGYPTDEKGIWNEEALLKYKTGDGPNSLKSRMTKLGYTFFLLRNAEGEIVGLASGNAAKDKSELRILNGTILRKYQHEDYVVELSKYVSHFASGNGYKKVTIPLSQYAQAKGNVQIYQHVAEELGIKFPKGLEDKRGAEAHPRDPDSVVLNLLPKRFIGLQEIKEPSKIQEAKPDILESFRRLKEGDETHGITKGCYESSVYPGNEKLNFQVVDFPVLAGDGKVSILGGNLSHLFVSKNEGTGKPELNTTNIETLIKNIKASGTKCTLMIDNDALTNTDAFVEKYYKLRHEIGDVAKKDYTRAETTIISEFIKGGGLKNLVTKVLSADNDPSAPSKVASNIILNRNVENFLKDNLKIEGVIAQKPLTHGVWNIEGAGGKAMSGIQPYREGTAAVNRTFNLGTQPELSKLKEQGNKTAIEITEKVSQMQDMKKVNALETSRGITVP